MRALIQRVKRGGVKTGAVHNTIGRGLVVLLGVGEGDAEADADLLAEKTANLRIFSNAEGKFDHSLLDVKGEALVVSQFTLYGDASLEYILELIGRETGSPSLKGLVSALPAARQ